MRINLDRAEELITQIRAAEAHLNGLYAEWENLSTPAQGNLPLKSAKKRGGRKPQADSLNGRILAHVGKGRPDHIYTPEELSGPVKEPDHAKIKRALEKMVFKKKMERVETGKYRPMQKTPTLVQSLLPKASGQ